MTSDPTWRVSITDVPGVRVGHVTLAEGDTQTGVTAVLPFAQSVRHRKLFLGAAAEGAGVAWTGAQVAEDFGTFSSPIVLCNTTTVGIAYDALISLGHRRDPDLPVDDGWPPVVIGLDDGFLNDLRRRRISHDDVLRAIEEAQAGPAPCGSVGIGRGLCALGGKGGVGDCALEVRLAPAPGGPAAPNAHYVLGALVAANGGDSPAGGDPLARGASASMTVILATDAPLFPGQLRALAAAALRKLSAAAPLSRAEGRLALAFSTSNALENSLEDGVNLYAIQKVEGAALATLEGAASAAARVALRRALVTATAVTGRKGRTASPLGPEVIARLGEGPPL